MHIGKKKTERLKGWQTYSFGVGIADLQVSTVRRTVELLPLPAEIIEDLQCALKHCQTQEAILMEDRGCTQTTLLAFVAISEQSM